MIWASSLYRMAYQAGAAVTRPLRRLEVAVIYYRQDLSGPIEPFDSDLELEIVQASPEEIERAATALRRPDLRRRELFRWRLENGCVCFLARGFARGL
jgi:hypothetical protein